VPKTSEKSRIAAPGWAVDGELRFSGQPEEASLESLARRFELEPSGRWKLAVARPANAIGMSMQHGGVESDFHEHTESQLMYAVRGELTCETRSELWIVPPQSALWVPSGVVHKIRGRAPLEGYSLFVSPNVESATLPRECRAVSVTPLFRELLLRLATRPALYALDGPDARLVAVLLDELAEAKIEKHRLPMPSEPRLRRLVEGLAANPAGDATLGDWSRRLGVGERTLNRLLVRETGLSFGRFRQQLHITLALQSLSRGASVQSVATELGYESSSSFVTMFKKALGTSPGRYMAGRLGTEPR
jgi:AraC-like DNA-binding protein/mannose-6-phosphate isomerase-like protein (cupin superfamily)